MDWLTDETFDDYWPEPSTYSGAPDECSRHWPNKADGCPDCAGDKCSVCGHDAAAHFGKNGEHCDDCFGDCKRPGEASVANR